MKIKIYDPMPRNPETAQKIRCAAFTRTLRVIGAVSMPDDGRKVKFVGKGKNRVKRVSYR